VEPWIEFRYNSKPLHESFGLTGEDKGINFYPMGVTSDGAYHSDDLKLSYFNNFWGTKAGDTEWENLEPKYPDRAAWLRKTVPDAEDTDNPWIMVIR